MKRETRDYKPLDGIHFTRTGWCVHDDNGPRRARLEWDVPGFTLRVNLMLERDKAPDLNWFGSGTNDPDEAAGLAAALLDAYAIMAIGSSVEAMERLQRHEEAGQ